MTKNIKLRKGTPQDAPQIANLIMIAMSEECCQHFYGDKHTTKDFHRLITMLCAREDTQYSYLNTICAIINDEIVGISVSYDGGKLHELRRHFIAGALEAFGRDFSDMPDETQTGELYLDSLAVLPEHRGKGIAKLLLNATTERAMVSGIGPVGLLVDKNNPNAERLYISIGFQYVGDNIWGGHEMKHMQMHRR